MKTRIPILIALILLMAALAACAAPTTQSSPGAAQAAAQEETAENLANPEALVDTAWILEHLDDPNVRLLDISGRPETYAEGHLPGAQYVNLGEDLTNPDDPVRGQILTREALSALMSRLGVDRDQTIVFYDDNSNLLATRAYWAVKYYQHEDVRVYDGGSKKWVADGNALTTEVPEFGASDYVADEADPAIRTTWEDVVNYVDDPSTLFCDVRGPKEFTGTDVRAERGGHVPGAINIEWTNAVNDDGTFRSVSALSELYSKAGFTPDKKIITYCQTGVRGAHTWFVLREMLGYPDVRNYDGSWEEYGNNPDSPIDQ